MSKVFVYAQGHHMGMGAMWELAERVCDTPDKAEGILLAKPEKGAIQTEISRDEVISRLKAGEIVVVCLAGTCPDVRALTPIDPE